MVHAYVFQLYPMLSLVQWRAICFLLFPLFRGNCLATSATPESNRHSPFPPNTDKTVEIAKSCSFKRIMFVSLLNMPYIWLNSLANNKVTLLYYLDQKQKNDIGKICCFGTLWHYRRTLPMFLTQLFFVTLRMCA